MCSEVEDASDGKTGLSARSQGIAMPKWLLMERLIDRETFLVDSNTSNAYTSQKGSLPVLRGRMVSGKATLLLLMKSDLTLRHTNYLKGRCSERLLWCSMQAG